MRRLVLTAAGAVLGLGALLGVEIVVAANREYLPTDPGYVVEATVGQGSGEPVELVVLGDSTVAGVGSPTLDDALAIQVAERAAAELGRPVHVVGYGASGARTDDVRTEQVPQLLDAGVDVVLVVIGSNDVTHLTPWWQMDDRTAAALTAARQRAAAPVVLGGIPQFRTVPALDRPLRDLVGAYAGPLRDAQRAAVERLGEGYAFVDIAAEASPRFVGVPGAMSSDGFHPSEVGYGYWADALAPAVVEAVRGGDAPAPS